jgi:hypothetical protein
MCCVAVSFPLKALHLTRRMIDDVLTDRWKYSTLASVPRTWSDPSLNLCRIVNNWSSPGQSRQSWRYFVRRCSKTRSVIGVTYSIIILTIASASPRLITSVFENSSGFLCCITPGVARELLAKWHFERVASYCSITAARSRQVLVLCKLLAKYSVHLQTHAGRCKWVIRQSVIYLRFWIHPKCASIKPK